MQRDHSLEPRGDIVVVKLLGAGSLFIALPNLISLRRRYPQRKIHLVTGSGVVGFARSIGIFDEIHPIDFGGFVRLVASTLRALRRLNRADTVIDLEVHSRAVTLFAVLLRARNRLAFFTDEDVWKRRIATHLVFLSTFAPIFEYYDQIFGLFDISPASPTETRDYVVKLSGQRNPKRYDHRHICIGHACSDLTKERQLSAPGWAYVLTTRFSRDETIFFELLGGAQDSLFGEQIAVALKQTFQKAIVRNSCGAYQHKELFGVLDGADEFWGIDSALLHIARSLDKPATSFWGPSSPTSRLRVMRPELDCVHYEKIACSPCVHVSSLTPCHGDNICMQRISGVPGSRERKPVWVVVSPMRAKAVSAHVDAYPAWRK
jgi:ADP-heptose:LPS heptosyltransferase